MSAAQSEHYQQYGTREILSWKYCESLPWKCCVFSQSIVNFVIFTMVRAALMQAREVMDAMQKDADFSEIKLLRVDGGASHNDLLMQMQANALQVSSARAASCCICFHSRPTCIALTFRCTTLACSEALWVKPSLTLAST